MGEIIQQDIIQESYYHTYADRRAKGQIINMQILRLFYTRHSCSIYLSLRCESVLVLNVIPTKGRLYHYTTESVVISFLSAMGEQLGISRKSLCVKNLILKTGVTRYF